MSVCDHDVELNNYAFLTKIHFLYPPPPAQDLRNILLWTSIIQILWCSPPATGLPVLKGDGAGGASLPWVSFVTLPSPPSSPPLPVLRMLKPVCLKALLQSSSLGGPDCLGVFTWMKATWCSLMITWTFLKSCNVVYRFVVLFVWVGGISR